MGDLVFLVDFGWTLLEWTALHSLVWRFALLVLRFLVHQVSAHLSMHRCLLHLLRSDSKRRVLVAVLRLICLVGEVRPADTLREDEWFSE